MEVRCPIHDKPLYGNGQTSTHNLFKCPDCDYSGGGPGAVREDLPDRYNELEAINKSQAEHINLLNQCDDTSTDVIGKMDEEIEQLKAENKRLSKGE